MITPHSVASQKQSCAFFSLSMAIYEKAKLHVGSNQYTGEVSYLNRNPYNGLFRGRHLIVGNHNIYTGAALLLALRPGVWLPLQ